MRMPKRSPCLRSAPVGRSKFSIKSLLSSMTHNRTLRKRQVRALLDRRLSPKRCLMYGGATIDTLQYLSSQRWIQVLCSQAESAKIHTIRAKWDFEMAGNHSAYLFTSLLGPVDVRVLTTRVYQLQVLYPIPPVVYPGFEELGCQTKRTRKF